MRSIRYIGTMPRDFEAFPRGCERSQAGCLPLVPGRAFDVTEDEYGALLAAGVSLVDMTPPAPTPVEPPPILVRKPTVDDLPMNHDTLDAPFAPKPEPKPPKKK